MQDTGSTIISHININTTYVHLIHYIILLLFCVRTIIRGIIINKISPQSDFELSSSYVRQKYHFFHFGEAKNEKSFPSAASQRCDAYDRVEESDLFLMEVKRLKSERRESRGTVRGSHVTYTRYIHYLFFIWLILRA